MSPKRNPEAGAGAGQKDPVCSMQSRMVKPMLEALPFLTSTSTRGCDWYSPEAELAPA